MLAFFTRPQVLVPRDRSIGLVDFPTHTEYILYVYLYLLPTLYIQSSHPTTSYDIVVVT